jgi:NDP-sugar pyrophosphorylase family protein
MLPIDGRPLLEHIVGQLRTAGVKKVNITTHYKAQVIEDHFRDGKEFGLDISYVDEKQPLGTAGALSLMEHSDEPVLVINGDIVTRVDLRAMLDFHTEHRAQMTVAVREHNVKVPYGVVSMSGVDVSSIVEKPVHRFLINAGIYLISPDSCRKIPYGKKFDMPELIQQLLDEGHRVIGFPIQEYWLDIGHVDDYTRAQADARLGELAV